MLSTVVVFLSAAGIFGLVLLCVLYGNFSPLSGTCVTVASVVSTVDSSVVTATFSVLSVSTVITGSATVSCVICVTASCHFQEIAVTLPAPALSVPSADP